MEQKFIITSDGYLRLGMVKMHKDLLEGNDICIGGGYYQFDYLSNSVILDREPYDFGKPRWNLLNDVLKVPSDYRGMTIIYQNYNDTFNVSEAFKIEYYR